MREVYGIMYFVLRRTQAWRANLCNRITILSLRSTWTPRAAWSSCRYRTAVAAECDCLVRLLIDDAPISSSSSGFKPRWCKAGPALLSRAAGSVARRGRSLGRRRRGPVARRVTVRLRRRDY